MRPTRPVCYGVFLCALWFPACDSGLESPEASSLESSPSAAWFVDASAAVGIDFTYTAGHSGLLEMPEVMGAGLGLFDADSDGDLDLYFVNGTSDYLEAKPSSLHTNRFYENRSTDSETRFVETTADSGLGDGGYGMGLAVGDIDNDGDVDVYVTNFGSGRLYLNEGSGRFKDVTEASSATLSGWPSSAAFVDYDRDGFLDLFVTRYVVLDPDKECFSQTGRPDICGPKAHEPASDLLFHNQGDGTFLDVSAASGIASTAAAGLGVVCEDLDADGLIDIYVANDAYANNLWLNQGDGTFKDSGRVKGAALGMNGRAEAGMGVVVADLNEDETLDLFVTHLEGESNTLYLGRAKGRGFQVATTVSGLAASSIPYTGFGTVAFDVELDGDLDLLVVGGQVVLDEANPDSLAPAPWDSLAEQNLLYLNDGKGRFTERIELAGALGSNAEVSRGLAVGDIDGDGDQDIVVCNIESPARVFLNEAPRQGRWLSVRAFDPALNRDAHGARIVVQVGDRRLLRTIAPASSYLTSSDPRAHFGLGEVDGVEHVEILWLDGFHERFMVECVDCAVELRRGEGEEI